MDHCNIKKLIVSLHRWFIRLIYQIVIFCYSVVTFAQLKFGNSTGNGILKV